VNAAISLAPYRVSDGPLPVWSARPTVAESSTQGTCCPPRSPISSLAWIATQLALETRSRTASTIWRAFRRAGADLATACKLTHIA